MLEVENLACVKGERILFQAVSFSLAAGQMLRVAGENGVGKTSLLRLVCALALPETGEVRWCGADIAGAGRDDFHTRLLYLGHAAMVNALLTPLENLQFLCAGDASPASRQSCVAALEDMGLGAVLDLPVGVLSQGQRRRVALARLALAQNKTLWVLDEPFVALDQLAVEALAASMDAHCARGGAVLFVSHQTVALGTPLQLLTLAGGA